MSEEYILQAEGLVKHFPITKGAIRKKVVGKVSAVNDVNLAVRPNETLGLVGESGCGKSTAGRTILKLLQPTAGKVIYNGQDITGLSRHDMVPLRRETADDLPGPVLVAESAAHRRRHHLGSVRGAGHQAAGRREERRARDHGARRPEPRALQPVPERVQWRPAPAHRHRPCRHPAAEGHRLRRAGVGARRVDPGAGHQPPAGPAGRVRHRLRLRRARPLGGAADLASCRGDVPRQHRRDH